MNQEYKPVPGDETRIEERDLLTMVGTLQARLELAERRYQTLRQAYVELEARANEKPVESSDLVDVELSRKKK